MRPDIGNRAGKVTAKQATDKAYSKKDPGNLMNNSQLC